MCNQEKAKLSGHSRSAYVLNLSRLLGKAHRGAALPTVCRNIATSPTTPGTGVLSRIACSQHLGLGCYRPGVATRDRHVGKQDLLVFIPLIPALPVLITCYLPREPWIPSKCLSGRSPRVSEMPSGES
jgi:hypothetical protein